MGLEKLHVRILANASHADRMHPLPGWVVLLDLGQEQEMIRLKLERSLSVWPWWAMELVVHRLRRRLASTQYRRNGRFNRLNAKVVY